MPDLRAEATRIGYWNEGHAQYEAPDADLLNEARALAASLIARGLIEPTREDTHVDDCD